MGSSLQQWRLSCGSFASKLSSSSWTATSQGGFTSARQERANSQWEDTAGREWLLLSFIFTIFINGLVLTAKIAANEMSQHLGINHVSVEGGVRDGVKLVSAFIVFVLCTKSRCKQMPKFCFFFLVSVSLNVSCDGQTSNIPMSRGLLLSILMRAGIEQNPGPVDDQTCKGHEYREKVEKNLRTRLNEPYEPITVRDKKVFNVSVGPEKVVMSLEEIENNFEKGMEWLQMQTDVFPVPTTILKKRMKCFETLKDIEKEITTEFQKMSEVEKKNLTQKQRTRMAQNEQSKKQVEGQIKSKVEKEMKSNPELKSKIDFYKNRLGDEAEDLVLEGITAALAGIPALVINGVKFYTEFPESLKKAGILLKSSGPSHQREMDMIVFYPLHDVLCVRFIEVKRSVNLPYEEPQKTLNKELTKKMIEQLEKNVEEYLRLFPDVHPSKLDIKILGAIPYTSGQSTFCEDCERKTLVQEDFNVSDSGERIRSKLGLPSAPGPSPVMNSSEVMETFKRTAARLLGLHSLVHMDLRQVGSGPRAAGQRLEQVEKEVGERLEEGVLFSPQQRDVLMGPVQSTFIWGRFGSGKTVIAETMVNKFLVSEYTDNKVIILASFSRLNCDKLVDRFSKLFPKTDEHIEVKTYNAAQLLNEFGVKNSGDTVNVLNKLLQRAAAKFPHQRLMIMLDEMTPYSRVNPISFNWTELVIPEPHRVTLVTCLQPISYINEVHEVIPPPENVMRPLRLTRQYRSVDAINALLNFISENITSGHKLLDCPAESGHDISGPVPQYYNIKEKGRFKPERGELEAVLSEIGQELSSIHGNMSSVTIICLYDDIVSTVREVAPQFPRDQVTTPGSFLGCESQAVVYITPGGVYWPGDMNGISRAGVSLYIVAHGKGNLQKALDKVPPQLLKKRKTPEVTESNPSGDAPNSFFFEINITLFVSRLQTENSTY